jgi:SWIM zinc finger
MNQIQYYLVEEKKLAYSQRHKVEEILKHHCIQYMPEDQSYLCKPIPNYNKHIYKMEHTGIPENLIHSSAEEWTCNCQHWNTYFTPCAHIWALMAFFKFHQNYKKINELMQ